MIRAEEMGCDRPFKSPLQNGNGEVSELCVLSVSLDINGSCKCQLLSGVGLKLAAASLIYR